MTKVFISSIYLHCWLIVVKLISNPIISTANSDFDLRNHVQRFENEGINLENFPKAAIQLIGSQVARIYQNGSSEARVEAVSPEINLQEAKQQQQQSTQTTILNKKQNVEQLIKNINEKLQQIQRIEMKVTTIQEIFDYKTAQNSRMYYYSQNFSQMNAQINTNTITKILNAPTIEKLLQNDLELFSKRLMQKLENALNVVQELQNFFRTNITKCINDFDEDSSNENADADDEHVYDSTPLQLPAGHLLQSNLNSYIYHSCADVNAGDVGNDDIGSYMNDMDITDEATLFYHHKFHELNDNYNDNEHIEIINYDHIMQEHKDLYHNNDMMDASLLNEDDEGELNNYIRNKINSMKMNLAIKNPAKNPADKQMKCWDNHIKYIYFLAYKSNRANSIDAFDSYHNEHFHYLYTSSIQNKYVLLLLDVGSAINIDTWELTKTYVSKILQLLSDDDLLTLVTICDEVEHIPLLNATPQDAANGIYPAKAEHKDEILHYLHSIVLSKAATNHTLAFGYVFKLLNKLESMQLIDTIKQPIIFLYITPGIVASNSDSQQVFQEIAKGQSTLKQPIILNACSVIKDEENQGYNKQFLNNLITPNYTGYNNILNVHWSERNSSLVGQLLIIIKQHPDKLMNSAVVLFDRYFREPFVKLSTQIQAPKLDHKNGDSIVSVTKAILPFGVIGVDLYLSDLIEDIVTYQPYQQLMYNLKTTTAIKTPESYGFFIDMKGRTLAHPALVRPFKQDNIQFPVDIVYLENSTNFIHIRRRMLLEKNGTATSTVYVGNANRKPVDLVRYYQWQNILNVYILCIVITASPDIFKSRSNNDASNGLIIGGNHMDLVVPPLPVNNYLSLPLYSNKNHMIKSYQMESMDFRSSMDLLYHRLDLLPIEKGSNKLCTYFRQLSTVDAPTLYLSPAAFKSPFAFLHNQRFASKMAQLQTLESIMAYLKDTIGLLANPGLRPHVRLEVNIIYQAMQHLKKRHQDSRGTLRNHIIRRYIASVNGVLQIFPGCLLSHNFNPAQRPWYRKALQFAGKIISTEPYLDAAGAGYIITIARTIFEGKSYALHSRDNDRSAAIVALDLPYTYFYKMILDTTPMCQSNNIKCLLFENEGYLIAHPTMLEATTKNRNQHQNQRHPHVHLTHKESYLANDMLNHKSLVRKLACANYQNRTIQRYYMFSTSLNETLTNVVHGERTKYAITLLSDSNIFGAVLNSSCDGDAFCPCSTIDRMCLNCKRMDQMDCECPCECPMPIIANPSVTFSQATANTFWPNLSVLNITHQYGYCHLNDDEFLLKMTPSLFQYTLRLPHCPRPNCDLLNTQLSCLAVMGCEWCQQDVGGEVFADPFCTMQSECFNGVLASPSPYGELDDAHILEAHNYHPDEKSNSYPVLLPIAGAVIILLIAIGFAIYCYQHNVDSGSQEHFYLDSMQEDNFGLPLSRFNFDDCQVNEEPPSGGGTMGGLTKGCDSATSIQRNIMNAANISPYHLSTGSSYRRPPNGESDHGYSTMTPHEDSSDHQCFALAEPLLLHEKHQSISDTMSISTSISSPNNRQSAQLTHFPANTNKQITSPKAYHSPCRIYKATTTLPFHDEDDLRPIPGATNLLLAPVTVHRHMETNES